MSEFVGAALAFPAVIFTFLLVVVVGYWVLVLVGGADTDVLDGDGGFGGLGLGGVPATVALSVLVTLAWFVSVAGVVLLDGVLLRTVVVLPVALVVGLVGTRLLVLPLRGWFAEGKQESRMDFVGRTCVIRTGSVGTDFGQAEVTAADGSSAVVQVRQSGGEALTSGAEAMIYDYDADGEFFWVSAMERRSTE
ncbi:MAG TPA: hypothetical protein VFV67_08965 [Actinophytocola sp.]|uniref:hypothetical protein n=1 Tax=Actinophytocola sp. TaxID=1872138 RepID=UPI002DB7F882|nr:hypothetical protein [Actinophytocola sp.]HEU5470772.1 hypothetical protein [Actinophytocola sp.]